MAPSSGPGPGVDQAADAAGRPGPGRPRSAEADRAIDRAALELLAEAGFEGVTIEAVAARAGVARSTVYRRYPCKTDLVVQAAARASDEGRSVPDTGSIEGDLLDLARQLHRMLTDSLIGRTVPAALAAAARHPALAEGHRAMVKRRRNGTKAVIDRAVARGELPADLDTDLLFDLVSAPIFYRVLISGEPVTEGYLRRVVHTAVEGVRAG